jgi:hypothetical protein
MATSRRGSDVVGYNVQVAVDTEGSGVDGLVFGARLSAKLRRLLTDAGSFG